MTRRRFLASTAIVSVAALLPGLAAAFAIEPADADTARLYLTACGSQDAETHRRMVAELRTRLDGKSDVEIEAEIAKATCSVCGCALVAATD